MATKLDSPILQEGIRNAHFFNGRLLTAESLQDEQQANRQQHRQLGLAAGHGIVHGLEVSRVSGSATAVRVTPGLAINRKGQALALNLAEPVTIVLAPESEAIPREAGLFAACAPPATDAPYHEGLFVLALSPTAAYQGRAPRVSDAFGAGGNGVADSCDYRYVIEGVKFRLVQVALNNAALVPPAQASALDNALQMATAVGSARARNLLAHLFLGTPEAAQTVEDLFRYVSTAERLPGVLERLPKWTLCDVPLAVLYWGSAGLRLLDMWAVRRRLVHRPLAALWPPPVDEARLAAGEAAFMQFQQQVADLVNPAGGLTLGGLTAVNARNYFRYLPAAGLIPLSDGGRRGFNYLNFFHQLTTSEPAIIPAAQVEPLLRDSFAYPAADLQDAATAFSLYLVQQNLDAVNENPTGGPLPYLLFSRAEMPYLGEIVQEDDNVAITGVLPPGSLRIGDELQILGRNFGFSQGAHAVYFNSARATQFRAGSSDTRLVVIIPPIPGIVAPDTPVTLTVSNLSSAAAWSEPLLIGPPPEIIEGNISVTLQGTTPTTPTAGEPLTFQYRLESQASAAVNVALGFELSAEGWPEPEWRSVSGAPFEPTAVPLPSGAEFIFHVHISQIPRTAQGQPFSVTLTADAAGIPGDQDGPRDFVVGQAAPQPDPTITTLAFNTAAPPGAVSGGVITVPVGSPVTVQLRAEFTGPIDGHPGPHLYNLSVAPQPTVGWTAVLASGPIFGTPPSYVIDGPATRFPAFTITAAANAASPATITFTLARARTDFLSTISFTAQT